jgi:tRNA dimethylallyltransferase
MANLKPLTELLNTCEGLGLAGPTASGKTALALALAREMPVEIISVDSALVYQEMDIGTAKPSAEELAMVPHHLIDIRPPTQAYSAAEFARDATRLMGEIRARGKLPLLVGGTMLYFKALMEGLDDLPLAQPEVRAQIQAQAAQHGWPALHAELATVDPVTAARLPPHDAQRIARALEVWRVSGQTLSSFFGASKVAGPRIAMLSLEPTDRAWLHERIALRFDQMLHAGLVAEVQALRQQPQLHADLPSMRCVGYRQVWEALDAAERSASQGFEAAPQAQTSRTATRLSPQALQELRDKGVAASRQLAKRQLTWLRSMPDRHVIACDQGNVLANALQVLRQLQA